LIPQMNEEANVESRVNETYVFTIRLDARFIPLTHVNYASLYRR